MDLAKLLAAASNPQRLSILKILAEDPQVGFTEIMKKTGLTSGNLGFHLKELLESRLVEKKNSDRYRLTDAGLSLMDWAGQIDRGEVYKRKLKERVEMKNILDPLRLYRTHPGRGSFRLGVLAVIVGILLVVGVGSRQHLD